MIQNQSFLARVGMTVRGRQLPTIPAVLAWMVLLFVLGSAAAADLYDIPASTPARVVDHSFFGTHFHRLVSDEEPTARTTSWPKGQIGSLRLWDSSTRWADLEPTRGAFNFTRLDAYVARAKSNGASVLMVLGSPPRWASARPDEPGPYGPGCAAEPANLDDWDRYVSAVARRYKGRITKYELWNEPYFSDLPGDRGQAGAFFSGSVAAMVDLARRTRAVLDRDDPRAVLLTPGFVGGVHRMEMFLRAGGAPYVGGVAYHFYASEDRELIKLHNDIRVVMTRYGLSQLPLYNTESGFAAADANANANANATSAPAGSALPDRTTAAALLARSMVLGAYLGIDRFYQYAWDNGLSGMVMPDTLAITPSATALASMRRWLLGTTLTGCHLEPGDTVQCKGTRAGNRLMIMWRASGAKPAVVRLPPFVQPVAAEYASDHRQPIDLAGMRESGILVGIDPLVVWSRVPVEAIRVKAPTK